LNHLTQTTMARVTMTNPPVTTTQTRTFSYDSTTQRLTSVTNPENGQVSYTYNADGTVATKIDAKNQKVAYTYDSFERVATITRYPVASGAPDPCQTMTFTYDYNPAGLFPNYPLGRVAAADWGSADASNPCGLGQFSEQYSYTDSGLVTQKRLQVTRGAGPGGAPISGNLDANYAYDNEGKVSSFSYPNATGLISERPASSL